MTEAKGGWERVLTVEVMRHKSGLFMASSPDIKGLFAHGNRIVQTLERVERCVADLADAGCKQSREVLARAYPPAPETPPAAVPGLEATTGALEGEPGAQREICRPTRDAGEKAP